MLDAMAYRLGATVADQVAMASPAAVMATCGIEPPRGAVDKAASGDHAPPAGRMLAYAEAEPDPVARVQATTALPAGSRATVDP
jgi:hypothetical protein